MDKKVSKTVGNSTDKDLYRLGYLSVLIEVTNGCNLDCKYCYAEVNPPIRREPSLAQLNIIKDKCESVSQPKIFYELSGGEPLIRKDWASVCELFLSTEKEVYINSNATLVDEEIAKKMSFLSNKFGKRLYYCSSLDSHMEEANNLNRGKYKEVIRGFDLLRDNGVRLKVSTTLTSHNVDTIYDTFRFIANNYTKDIMLTVIKPTFKMTSENKSLFVPYERVLEISRNLTELAKKESWNFFCSLDSEGKAFCKAGRDRIFINTAGYVTPCCFLRQPEFILGNIYNDSLETILGRMDDFSRGRDKEVLLCEHLQAKFGEPPFRIGK